MILDTNKSWVKGQGHKMTALEIQCIVNSISAERLNGFEQQQTHQEMR